MGWSRKNWIGAERLMDPYEEHPFSRLRNAVPSRIEQGVPDAIPLFPQVFCNRLRHVASAMIQDIRDVLHEKSHRFRLADVVEIPLPQVDATVDQEGDLGVIEQLPPGLVSELGSANPGEGLTRGTSYENVHLILNISFDTQIPEDRLRILLGYVSSGMMPLDVCPGTATGEVRSVALGRQRIDLDRRDRSVTGGGEPKRDSTATGE
jgi:hypothetical protein